MLALLLEARRYRRLVGIESRPRTASLASMALAGPGVEILSADGRETPIPACDAVLLFDVLHMMPIADQDVLLAAVRAALRPGGVALVREADAGGGWRFLMVRTGNRLKALLSGNWRQPLVFRRPDEWIACFQTAGFDVETFPGPPGHPFANTLFRLSTRITG
jgi:SAM-dependent methyltransferase